VGSERLKDPSTLGMSCGLIENGMGATMMDDVQQRKDEVDEEDGWRHDDPCLGAWLLVQRGSRPDL
jgi:hypothetical protein